MDTREFIQRRQQVYDRMAMRRASAPPDIPVIGPLLNLWRRPGSEILAFLGLSLLSGAVFSIRQHMAAASQKTTLKILGRVACSALVSYWVIPRLLRRSPAEHAL